MNKFFNIVEKQLSSSDIVKIASVEEYKNCSSLVMSSVGDLRFAKKGDIVYFDTQGVSAELSREKYSAFISDLKASAVIVRDSMKGLFEESSIAVFVSKNPKKSFIALQKYFIKDVSEKGFGISDKAIVDSSVKFDSKDFVAVGHFSIIEKDVKIGKNVVIGNNVVIGAGVELGEGCVIRDGATVKYSKLGKFCVIDEGAKIGGDGFGWASDGDGHTRVVHTGSVVLGDFVEVGLNSCIDRGVFENTIISDGVKIDNLCQIGHNAKIGKHSILAGGVCVAGSAELGAFVLVGGNSAIAGHLKVEDGVSIGGMSGVISNIEAGNSVWGIPARNKREFLRQTAILRGLAKRKK